MNKNFLLNSICAAYITYQWVIVGHPCINQSEVSKSGFITCEPAAALLMRLLLGLAIQNVETALFKIPQGTQEENMQTKNK